MNRKILYLLLLFLFIILLKDLNAEAKPVQGICIKVYDGDTIKIRIEGTKTLYRKVRLIGVDTPEMDHPDKKGQRLAREAKSFAEKMVLGKRIILEFDWDKEDKYGRLLAYVFLQDGRMLNAEIIKQGYGFAYTRFPFRYMDEFRRYEREAREKGLGLWKGGGKA
ncbi:MAG: thermonuclease family protein, partial [Nitrospirae bacterium]|nr:thermonuclease family protein [Nitrospirota bacterium]